MMSQRLCIFACVLFSPMAAAAPLTGQFVTRGNGNPIGDVAVRINDENKAESDETGAFTIELPEGPHTLTFDSVDHEPKTIQITMPLSKPIRVYLEPIAAPLELSLIHI